MKRNWAKLFWLKSWWVTGRLLRTAAMLELEAKSFIETLTNLTFHIQLPVPCVFFSFKSVLLLKLENIPSFLFFGWLDKNTCVQICIDCYQNAKATFGSGFNLAAPVAEIILSGNKFAQIKKKKLSGGRQKAALPFHTISSVFNL